jgi:hypothetical protein
MVRVPSGSGFIAAPAWLLIDAVICFYGDAGGCVPVIMSSWGPGNCSLIGCGRIVPGITGSRLLGRSLRTLGTGERAEHHRVHQCFQSAGNRDKHRDRITANW